MHPPRPRNLRAHCWLVLVGVWLALPLARAEQVILHLRNGDRVSGEITAETDRRVTLKTPRLGKLRIDKAEIERREIPNLAASPAPRPAVAATPKPASPKTAPPTAGTGPAAPPTLSTNLAESPWYRHPWIAPLLTNWNVNLQFGSDLGFGTADRQTFSFTARAVHRWDRVRNAASYNVFYGFVNDVQSNNRMDGALKTDVDLGTRRKLYLYTQGGAGYDAIRLIELQYQAGSGVGYKLYERPGVVINAELGAEYQSFDFRRAPDREIYAARIAENMSWRVTEKLNINQNFAFNPNMTDPTDYRFRFQLSLAYPLFKRVTINLSVIDDYDSNPPAGVDRNDLLIQSLLGISF
jgi:putative salt-induced outer membrane protein